MATTSDVLRVAAGEVGYYRHNDPEHGTKYGRWYAERVGDPYYGENGVPYCAMYVSWVLAQVGVDFTYAYCPYILRDYGSRAVGKSEARPGDVVLFDWGRAGVPDHVGFVEANRGSHYQTIEGNTSRGDGSQSDGGWVARRTRSLGDVRAVIRLDLAGGAGAPAPSQPSGLDLGDTSWTGPRMISELQRQRGTSVDGCISGQTAYCRGQLWRVQPDCLTGGYSGGSGVVGSLQSMLGVERDGYAGSGTISALQRWLAARGWYSGDVDGSYGPATSRGVGMALQAGAFRA